MPKVNAIEVSNIPVEYSDSAGAQKKSWISNLAKRLSKRSENPAPGGVVKKNVSLKPKVDLCRGLSAVSAESKPGPGGPVEPLTPIGFKKKLEADLEAYYQARPDKLSADIVKLKEYMSVDKERRISVGDESTTREGFVKFFEAVRQAGHGKNGELVKLLNKHNNILYPKDHARAVSPRVQPEVSQPPSHEFHTEPVKADDIGTLAAANDTSQEVVSVDVMYVYISMLNNYLWTKDGVSFGAYEAGHAKRIEDAFKKYPQIGKVLSLVPYKVINKSEVENRLQIQLDNSASLKKSDVEAMYKALAEGHDSQGSFFKLLGNFDFVAVKQQVMDPEKLEKKAIETTVGWYDLWMQDGCTVETMDAFRELLQQLKMTSVDEQQELGDDVVERLIKAFGHLDEQMKSVERDAAKLLDRYVPQAGQGGLLAVLKNALGWSKSGDQVSAAADDFGKGLETLGKKTVEMLSGALEKLDKEFGAEQVAGKTTGQVNKLLGRASSDFKAQFPRWTNFYPQALSEPNAKLIRQRADAFNAEVRKKIATTYMDTYMEVVKEGVKGLSCDAVDKNVGTRKVFPLVMQVHAELGRVPDRAMKKLDELFHMAGCAEVSIDEQKSKFNDDLQLQLNKKFDADVGSATTRWVGKLQSVAGKTDMQDRINALAERVPTLHKQLEDLNGQPFLKEDSRQVLRKHIGLLVGVNVTGDLQKPGFWATVRRGWKRRFEFRPANIVAGAAGAATIVFMGMQLPKSVRVPFIVISSAIAALKWGVIGIFKSLGERKNAVTQIECIQNAWKAIERMAVPAQASEMPQR